MIKYILLAYLFLFLSCSHLTKSSRVMISSQGKKTTQIGLDIIKQGGNLFDAAAAMSFAISVERPQSTGIGGGGFMMIRHASSEKIEAVDFREKAPLKSSKKMFLDSSGNEIKNKSLNGIFASGVPGLVAGVIEIHQKYGKLPLAQIIEPAIQLALNGIEVDSHLGSALEKRQNILREFPSSKKIFFKEDQILKKGDILKQFDLAESLKEIQRNGRNGFYQNIASKIVKTSKRYDGLLTENDFKNYNVVWREPVYGEYRGNKIFSMPPPSSGGVHLIEMLNILENVPLNKIKNQSTEMIHLITQAMQQAYADRAAHMADSDFIKVPLKDLISKKYAVAKFLDFKNQARQAESVQAGNFEKKEPTQTTHFSLIDEQGNMISSTQTINGWLGSGLVAEGTGILLNNEMDDFSTKPNALNSFGAVGSDKNLVEPQKRPLSSMTPTLVIENDGKSLMALGTVSGTEIINCVLSTLIQHLDYKESLFAAIQKKRFHNQWKPDILYVEKNLLSKKQENVLAQMGYKIQERASGCKVQAVERNAKGELIGASDPRGEGLAKGL